LNVHIKDIIADALARAFIKQVEGHSGYFGCEKFEDEGEYLSGSLSFPEYRLNYGLTSLPQTALMKSIT